MVLKNLAKKFARDTGGNYAMIFALVAVPMFAGIGLTIDYASMSQKSSQLQNATDSAALFASRYYEVNRALPSNEDVLAFIATNYSGPVSTYNVQIIGTNIIVDATVSGQAYVMGMFSDEMANVAARSAAPIASNTILEVALALDTTYSMIADGKIAGLKAAAASFTEQVMGTDPDQTTVKLGVVPFSQYVNVGMGNRAQPWLDVPADSQQTVPAQCYDRQDVVSSSNCRDVIGVADGVEYTYQTCDYEYGPSYEVCEPERVVDTKWYGCVGSRNMPLTLRDSDPASQFPGMMADWDMSQWECPTPVLPLTTDKAAVLASIDALAPRGETYIVEGVTWGTRVLSHDEPFTEGVDPGTTDAEVKKVLVLMSDGDNKASSQVPDYYGHWGTNVGQSDAWMDISCRNARQDDVEVYTITFGTAVSNSAKAAMRACAGSADHYFDAASSADLARAFDKIAGKLMRVRLTM